VIRHALAVVTVPAVPAVTSHLFFNILRSAGSTLYLVWVLSRYIYLFSCNASYEFHVYSVKDNDGGFVDLANDACGLVPSSLSVVG